MAIRMGGVDTQGDRGVMSAAMGAAQLKANAAKDSGLSAVGSQLSDWADDKMQEDRRIALEKRAETRGLAKEGRDQGVLEQSQAREDRLTKEKRAYDAPLQEAKIRQADAATRSSNRKGTATVDTTKWTKGKLKKYERLTDKYEALGAALETAEDSKAKDLLQARASVETELMKMEMSPEQLQGHKATQKAEQKELADLLARQAKDSKVDTKTTDKPKSYLEKTRAEFKQRDTEASQYAKGRIKELEATLNNQAQGLSARNKKAIRDEIKKLKKDIK